jgi:hypothetical protein
MSFVTEADQSESSKSPERCELGVSAPNRTTTIAHLSSLYDAEDDNACGCVGVSGLAFAACRYQNF